MRIPVTILSGFLGAGKTTLLNKLVQSHPEKKFGIIENEFGSTGIDGQLVVGAKEDIFELSNGCICCTLNDELILVLKRFLDAPERINHLIVETTGIADPGAVAMSFLSDYSVQKIFRLDAIITLADACFIEQQIVRPEAYKQMAMADVVLLTKTDLADSYAVSTAENIIKRINPVAKIIHSRNATWNEEIDLLNLNAFNKEGVLNSALNQSGKISANTFKNLKPAITSQNSLMQEVHAGLSAISFEFTENLNPERFDVWVRSLMSTFNNQLYRMKGILSMEGFPEKVIFQGVFSQFMLEKSENWAEGERISRIVFIGENLPKSFFEATLPMCYVDNLMGEEEFYATLYDTYQKLVLSKQQ